MMERPDRQFTTGVPPLRETLATALVLWFAVGCAGPTGSTKGSGALEPFGEAGVTERAVEGDRYALVVGIEAFEDDQLQDLRFAADDAEAVADALTDFDEVVRLTKPDETDRSDIFEALHAIGEKADAPRDTLFVYFSTHGTLGQAPGGRLQRYLVARDTKLDVVTSTGLKVTELLAEMEQFGAERTALVLATCHSGSGKSGLTDALAKRLAQRKSGSLPPLREVSEATILLSASAFEEPARESPSLRHDIYTYFFLEGLEKGDRDGNGAVTVSEAHDYSRQRTYAYTDGSQRPTAWSSVLGSDPIVLSGNPTGRAKPVVYSYHRSAQGMEMRVDGQKKGTLPGGVAVEPGRHRIELQNARTGATIWSGKVRLDEGERVEVSGMIPPPSTLAVRLSGGTTAALGSATRQSYFPVSWAGGGRVALLRKPWRHSLFEVRGHWFGSDGSLRAFDAELPYRLRGGHIQLGGGAVWNMGGGFGLQTGGDLGVLWATRRFDTSTYENVQRMRGTTLAAFTEVGWQFFEQFRASVRADLGVLRAPFGDSVRLHPYGGAVLGIGFGF